MIKLPICTTAICAHADAAAAPALVLCCLALPGVHGSDLGRLLAEL